MIDRRSLDRPHSQRDVQPRREQRVHAVDPWFLTSEASAIPAATLLGLQRAAGNQAVSALLRRQKSSLSAQRVAVVPSWSGTEDTSWNKQARTVTKEGTETKAGESGVVRIPVEGITVGHAGAEADELGGPSDPNIGKGGTPVKSVTGETVGSGEAGRAIVLMPPGLKRGSVDILFHLHGHTIGYRQVKGSKGKPAPPPRDVQYDRIAQQLLESGAQMIAILPQGKFKSGFGPGEQKGVNVDAYINQVFGLANLTGFKPGQVTLSGWSGAGAGVAEMIKGNEAADKIKKAEAAGKKVTPRDEAASVLPETSHFEGLFLFDALYGNQGDVVWTWLQAKLESEVQQLVELGTTAAQTAWIQSAGFRFRGVHTVGQGSGCEDNYTTLARRLTNWFKFGPHLKKITQGVVSADVIEVLHKNYQVVAAGAGVSHNQMIGGVGKGDLYKHENLRDALEALPQAPASVPSQPAHGRTPPLLRPAATGSAQTPIPAMNAPVVVPAAATAHPAKASAGVAPAKEKGAAIAARYTLSKDERDELATLETDVTVLQVAQGHVNEFRKAHKKKTTAEERKQLKDLQADAAAAKKKVAGDRKAFKGDAAKATLAKRDIELDLKEHGVDSLAKWYKDIDTSAHFLGVPIAKGIHADLRGHLEDAEKKLMDQTGITDPKKLGEELRLKEATGLRSPKPATGGTRPSMHCYGLAVDLNYAGSPFVGNAEAAVKPENRGDATSSKVIARAQLLVHQQQTDILDPGQVRKGVGEQYDFLHGASDALATYFAMPGKPKQLDELVGQLQKSGKDARDAKAWREQIEHDHAALLAKGSDFAGHADPAKGFLDLDKRLVLALSDAGLYWGGLYQTGKDIMHFDWRAGTIKR